MEFQNLPAEGKQACAAAELAFYEALANAINVERLQRTEGDTTSFPVLSALLGVFTAISNYAEKAALGNFTLHADTDPVRVHNAEALSGVYNVLVKPNLASEVAIRPGTTLASKEHGAAMKMLDKIHAQIQDLRAGKTLEILPATRNALNNTLTAHDEAMKPGGTGCGSGCAAMGCPVRAKKILVAGVEQINAHNAEVAAMQF